MFSMERGSNDSKILKPNIDLGCRHFPPPEDVPRAPLISVVDKQKIVAKRFLFSKEKLERIKELATSDFSSTVKDPTRVEALSAFHMQEFYWGKWGKT